MSFLTGRASGACNVCVQNPSSNLPGKRNVRANINRIKTTRSVGGAHGEKAKAATGDGDARTERDMNTSRGGSGTQACEERENWGPRSAHGRLPRAALILIPLRPGPVRRRRSEARARTTARHGPVPSPSAFQQSRSESNSDVALALSPGPRHGTPPSPTQPRLRWGRAAARLTQPRARVDHTTRPRRRRAALA